MFDIWLLFSACLPITIPECSVGLDYTETLLNYSIGLSPGEISTLLSSMSIIFESRCGSYFRPFMCSTFVPPCGQAFRPPCRELCQLAMSKCIETFQGQMTEEQLMPQGGLVSSGCDVLPSQKDSQCYNGKPCQDYDNFRSSHFNKIFKQMHWKIPQPSTFQIPISLRPNFYRTRSAFTFLSRFLPCLPVRFLAKNFVLCASITPE